MSIGSGWLDKHGLLRDVIQILRALQLEAYLVGGAVRDLLLGRELIVDLDFAVPRDGLVVARQVARAFDAPFYPLDPERGVGRVVYTLPAALDERKGRRFYLDFASFRGVTLQEDLADRDFTVNAIALSVTEPSQLIDPLNGWHDLETRQIRATSPAAFEQDPVRVLRAVRQAVDFGFVIEAETEGYLRQAAPKLAAVSPERQRDELLKLLNTPAPGQAVQTLRRLGVLPHVLPEVVPMIGVSQSLPHTLDVFDHTTAALDAWAGMLAAGWPDLPAGFRSRLKEYLQQPLAGELAQETLLPLALLLHDTGKPFTRTMDEGQTGRIRFLGHEQKSAGIARRLTRRLHFSSQAISFVETVVAHHMRPLHLAQAGTVSRRAIYRLFRDTAGSSYQAGVGLALHALADHQATYPPSQGHAELQALLGVVNTLLVAYFEEGDRLVDPPPLLSGHEIMQSLGLSEGRLVGQLLNRLKEAQVVGQVHDKAEALHFLKNEVESLAGASDDLNP